MVESLSFRENHGWCLHTCAAIRTCERNPPRAITQTHLLIRVGKPVAHLFGNKEDRENFGNMQLGFSQIVVILALKREVEAVVVQHIAMSAFELQLQPWRL